MKFIIHFLARTSFAQLPFDLLFDGPVTTKNLAVIRGLCAQHAMNQTFSPTGRRITADEIVIANIIPIPDGEPAVTPIGGS